MADFEAPSGPPPPKVPEGWVARWNEQYHEWFYVNTYTKKSQWDRPTAPAVDPNSDAPAGPPPGYTPGSTPAPSDSKTNPFVNASTKPGGPSESEDERLARQLQEEENARAQQRPPSTASRGAADSYMNSGGSPAPGQSAYPEQLPPRPDGSGGDKARGLLGKIFGSSKNKYPAQGGFPGAGGGGYGGPPPQQYGNGYGSPGPQQYGSPGPQQYGGYGPPPGQYGGYGGPPAGYGGGGYGAPGYGGPPGGYGGGYGQPAYYQQGRPQKAGSGGMGAMGGAALGLGAGVLGGALIADAIDDREDEAYAEGYNDGQDGGDFDGGDF